jgi:hypothetical protein
MARSEGLALAPWGVLGAGKIRTNAEEARRKESGEKGRMVFGPDWERTPKQKKVCDVLEEIGKELGTESITSSKWGNRMLHPQHGQGFTDADKQSQSRTTSKSSPTYSQLSVAEKLNSSRRTSRRWTFLCPQNRSSVSRTPRLSIQASHSL